MPMTLPDTDIIDRFVGMRLREDRLEKDVAQADLAVAVGISTPQIQRYENGSNRISASMLYQLATILCIGPSAFYEGLDTNPPGSLNKADPDVVRADVAHIVAGLDTTTLEIVRDVLVSLKKSGPSSDPVLPSRELALTAPRTPVPQVKKRRRARFRSKAHE